MLELQLRALRDAGITEARIMVGFKAEKVEAFLASNPVEGLDAKTVFNPFFDSTENLVTAWLACSQLTDDFLLLNGDTLFEPGVLRCLLDAPDAPITLVVNAKPAYDDDDMKVTIGGKGRIRAISKTLGSGRVDGESIGLMRFSGAGVAAFQSGLDRAVRTQRGVHAYYLSVIDELSRKVPVQTAMMTGLWWGELDSPQDLHKIRAELAEIRPSMDEQAGARIASLDHDALEGRRIAERPTRIALWRPAALARGTGL